MAVGPYDQFLDRAHPGEWLRVADNLLEHAVALHRLPSGLVIRTLPLEQRQQWPASNRSAFLLAGFALENALKAFLVFENPGWVSNGTLARKLKSHDLYELHGMVRGAPYAKRSAPVLRGFEDGLESWARYPCALKAADSRDEGILTERLWVAYLKLMKAYGRRLQDLMAGGWAGPNGYYVRIKHDGAQPLNHLVA